MEPVVFAWVSGRWARRGGRGLFLLRGRDTAALSAPRSGPQGAAGGTRSPAARPSGAAALGAPGPRRLPPALASLPWRRAGQGSLSPKRNNAVVKPWRVALVAVLRLFAASGEAGQPRAGSPAAPPRRGRAELPPPGTGKSRALRKRREFLYVCVRFIRTVVLPDEQRRSKSR